MLQTPAQPRNYRPLRARPLEFGLAAGKAGQYASYPGVPVRYMGIPNFMQYRLGPGAELPGAVLSNADLRWSNFRGANLSGAKLNGSVLWGSILTNANLRGADLRHADLTGVDLVGADLTNAKLEGACFLGARYNPLTCFPKGFGSPEKKGLVSMDHASMQIN